MGNGVIFPRTLKFFKINQNFSIKLNFSEKNEFFQKKMNFPPKKQTFKETLIKISNKIQIKPLNIKVISSKILFTPKMAKFCSI